MVYRKLLIVLIAASFSDLLAFDPDKFIRKIVAYQKKNSWAYQAIKQDIGQLTSKDLDPNVLLDTFDQYGSLDPHLYVFAFNGGKFYRCRFNKNFSSIMTRYHAVFKALEIISKYAKIPDCLFLLTVHDSYDSNLPILTFAKNRDAKSIKIPDFEALLGYEKLKRKVRLKSQLSSWESKKDKVFWRGATTGGDFQLYNFKCFPRSQGVLYSLTYPDILDARFSNFVQSSKDTESRMMSEGFIGSAVGVEDSIDYKFLIDIDGNSCTYSRMFWILLSNSLLFKLESPNVQWYYPLLENRKNFVSIKSDFSNLKGEFDYYLSHPSEAKGISENATRLALEELSHEACLAYFYCVLVELSKLQKTFFKD